MRPFSLSRRGAGPGAAPGPGRSGPGGQPLRLHPGPQQLRGVRSVRGVRPQDPAGCDGGRLRMRSSASRRRGESSASWSRSRTGAPRRRQSDLRRRRPGGGDPGLRRVGSLPRALGRPRGGTREIRQSLFACIDVTYNRWTRPESRSDQALRAGRSMARPALLPGRSDRGKRNDPLLPGRP